MQNKKFIKDGTAAASFTNLLAEDIGTLPRHAELLIEGMHANLRATQTYLDA